MSSEIGYANYSSLLGQMDMSSTYPIGGCTSCLEFGDSSLSKFSADLNISRIQNSNNNTNDKATDSQPCDNVYVRNLPASWTNQHLKDLFSCYGTVMECRVMHRGDESRGAGALVRMSSVSSATRAISCLNGWVPPVSASGEQGGSPLLVRFADSPEVKARKQLRKEQVALQLKFAPFGPISSVNVLSDHRKKKNLGFVNYADASSAIVAIRYLNGFKVYDKVLNVTIQ